MSRFDNFSNLPELNLLPGEKWQSNKAKYDTFISFTCDCHHIKIDISVEKGKTEMIESVSCPICGKNIISNFTVKSLET